MAIVKCKKANMRDLMLKLNDLLEDARLVNTLVVYFVRLTHIKYLNKKMCRLC